MAGPVSVYESVSKMPKDLRIRNTGQGRIPMSLPTSTTVNMSTRTYRYLIIFLIDGRTRIWIRIRIQEAEDLRIPNTGQGRIPMSLPTSTTVKMSTRTSQKWISRKQWERAVHTQKWGGLK
jgi:hypothetical protein